MTNSRAPRHSWASLARRASLALVLGTASTLLVSTVLALRQPVNPAGLTPPVARVAGLGAPGATGGSGVTISSDGQHLGRWHLLVQVPGARREIWFEKGRAYAARDAAWRLHPDTTSCAVACWSFATQSRATAIKSPLPLDPAIAVAIESDTPRIWGMAVDRRGWPFLALEAHALGTLEQGALKPWALRGGIDVDAIASAGGSPVGGGPIVAPRDSLASIRFIPMVPLWPGLLANTAIYALAWYGLMLLPGLILARWRTRAGCCPRCNYDLTGQREPGCPECGHGRGAGAAGGTQDHSRPPAPSAAGPAHTPA